MGGIKVGFISLMYQSKIQLWDFRLRIRIKKKTIWLLYNKISLVYGYTVGHLGNFYSVRRTMRKYSFKYLIYNKISSNIFLIHRCSGWVYGICRFLYGEQLFQLWWLVLAGCILNRKIKHHLIAAQGLGILLNKIMWNLKICSFTYMLKGILSIMFTVHFQDSRLTDWI